MDIKPDRLDTLEEMDNNGSGCHPELIADRRSTLPTQEHIDAVAGFFRVISDPTRVRILWALDGGELCVGDLTALMSMTVSAVSHQLKILKDTGLVKSRRSGKHIFYSLDDDHVKAVFETAVEHLEHRGAE